MATWAMKQRYAFIDQMLADGRPFTREALVEKFYITTQTASATIKEYQQLNPGQLAFDPTRKRFVSADLVSPPGLTGREARLLAALKRLYHKTIIGTDDERHSALDAAWEAISEAEGQEPASRVRQMLAASVEATKPQGGA